MGWTVAIWEFWPCWGVRGLSIRPTRPDDVACHEGLHILAPTTAVLQKKAQAITRKHLEGKLKSARRIGRQMLPGVSRTRVCIRGPGARATFAQVSSVFSSSSMLQQLKSGLAGKSYDRHGSGPLISITSKRSMDQDTQWTPISSSVRRTSACMWPIRNTRRGLGGERVTTFEAASEARSLSPLLYRRLFVACHRDGPSQLSVCKVLEDPVQYKMEAVSHIRLGLDSHEFFVCKGVLAVQSPEFSRHPRRTAV